MRVCTNCGGTGEEPKKEVDLGLYMYDGVVLPPMQAKMLGAILSHKQGNDYFATYDQIIFQVYGGRDEPDDINLSIRVALSMLRKNLPHLKFKGIYGKGVVLLGVSSDGYEVTPAGTKRVLAA